MTRIAHYRRVVITMREGPAPQPVLRLAAELAHLLDLELEGVFVENEALLHLAALPFAREFRLPGHTWQALDRERVAADLRHAAGRAEQLLAAAAHGLGVASVFSVLRADVAAAAALDVHADDILVMTEPEAERPDWPLGRPAADPEGAGACVLLAPAHPTSRHGPIAAAASPGVGLALARAIALRAGEDLLLLAAEGHAAQSLPLGPDFPARRVRRRTTRGLGHDALAHAASRERARLLVLEAIGESPGERRTLIRLVERTGMPVLLIRDPGSTTDE